MSILAYISVGSMGKSLYLSNSDESDMTSAVVGRRVVEGVKRGEEGGLPLPSSRSVGVSDL